VSGLLCADSVPKGILVIDDIEVCGEENPHGIGGTCELEPGHSGPHQGHNKHGAPITFGERNSQIDGSGFVATAINFMRE